MDNFQKADYNWLQCMMRIGRKETAYFEQDSVGYTDQMMWYTSRRKIMEWIYNTLVTAKKITPIEKLDLDVKEQMWGFINEICNGKEGNNQVRIEIAKAFYTIEYFLKEQS